MTVQNALINFVTWVDNELGLLNNSRKNTVILWWSFTNPMEPNKLPDIITMWMNWETVYFLLLLRRQTCTPSLSSTETKSVIIGIFLQLYNEWKI